MARVDRFAGRCVPTGLRREPPIGVRTQNLGTGWFAVVHSINGRILNRIAAESALRIWCSLNSIEVGDQELRPQNVTNAPSKSIRASHTCDGPAPSSSWQFPSLAPLPSSSNGPCRCVYQRVPATEVLRTRFARGEPFGFLSRTRRISTSLQRWKREQR